MTNSIIVTVNSDTKANEKIAEYEQRGYTVKNICTAMAGGSPGSSQYVYFNITIWFVKTEPMSYREPIFSEG